MARKLNGIELTRYDDLFKTDAEREADQQERVQIVPAEQVFPYARQPYSVDRPSADLVRLMDSIERTGIAEPLIVRPRSEGGYEIISGHRRDYCAKVVGLDTLVWQERSCPGQTRGKNTHPKRMAEEKALRLLQRVQLYYVFVQNVIHKAGCPHKLVVLICNGDVITA